MYNMIRGKKYRYDDEFKAKARAHQFAFRENELNDGPLWCQEDSE